MNYPLISALLLSLTLSLQSADKKEPLGEKPALIQKAKVVADKGEILYEVKDGEVDVKGSVITDIVIGKNVTVAYRNKTPKSLKPSYKICFYNAYGFLLGSDKVGNSLVMFGSSTRMEPGDISSEKLYFDWHPIDDIFRHSNLTLPEDFKTVKWIVISESNTQLKVK